MIKELIEKLGISRRTLSIYLNANQSNISRYENHTRNMPFATIPQVAKLVAMIHKAPAVALPQPTTEEREEAQKRADWCRVLCQPLQKKLASMQNKYEQANRMLSVLDAYTAANRELPPKMQSWVAGQYYAANRKREANGWQPQQEVQWKIRALDTEALFWENAISTDKN